jgi:hypothetical protein
MKEADQGDTATSQGESKIAWCHQTPGEGCGTDFPSGLQREQFLVTLSFLAFWSVIEYKSIDLSHPVCGSLLKQPWERSTQDKHSEMVHISISVIYEATSYIPCSLMSYSTPYNFFPSPDIPLGSYLFIYPSLTLHLDYFEGGDLSGPSLCVQCLA